MKKIIALALALLVCFVLFSGCSNDAPDNKGGRGTAATNSADNGLSSHVNKKTTYTFTEYLRENDDVPLLFFSTFKVSKDSVIDGIYVFENEKVKMFKNHGNNTLGDYAEMSDAEILAYLEGEWEKEFCTFVQTFIDDPSWPSRFRSGEATIYVKDYIDPEIELVTDDTGNNIARQTIYLPSETAGTLDSTVWYKNHIWKNTTDYDFINNRSISSMADIYCFDTDSKTYDIYSSRYIGLAPASGGDGLQRYLLTRPKRDVTITLDRIDDSAVVDLDDKEQENLAYSFYEQYHENYQTFDKVSGQFASLTLPVAPEALRIGYIEFEDFCYVDDTGKLTGYDVELMQKICDELGTTADFFRFDSQPDAEEALLNSTIDCFVGGITEVDSSKFVAEYSCRSIRPDNYSWQHCYLVFQKNLDGMSLISQVIDKFGKDGTIGGLLYKY